MTPKSPASIGIAMALFCASLTAQNAPSVESRLREQLKAMTTQLRTAETTAATLQAEKTALDEKVKALEKQVEELGKQLAGDRETAKAEGEKLRAEIATRDATIAQTREELVKATNFGTKTAEMLKTTEAERAKLAAEAIQLKRVVADQRVKNGKMFEISSEILTRYEKFGLGTALTAREPFVGITRARLESMVEEYGGKIAEQRLKAVGSTPPAGKPAASGQKRPKD
jgi:predicted RNase H-like nuclease (RuvC/YqgF family)